MDDTTRKLDDPRELPEAIRRYQEAHDRHETGAAVSCFTPDATVVDEGREHHGSGDIRRWLDSAGREFTYTRTFIKAEAEGADRWLVVNHLNGDFPGGDVDLRYQFHLSGNRIAALVIAP